MFVSRLLRSVYRYQQINFQVFPIKTRPVIFALPSRKFCDTSAECELKATSHVNLTEDVIQSLTKGEPNLVKRLKLIEFEYEVAKQEGAKVPSFLALYQWKELLELPSITKRKKYLLFLFKVEMTKLSRKQKKEEERVRREAEKEANKLLVEKGEEEHIQYGLGKNSILLKVYDTKIDYFHNTKMLQASIFDLPVVYDFSYEQHMTSMEQKNAAKQLVLSFVANREHNQPFPIQFCNVNFNGAVIKHLLKFIPSLYNPEFPISISQKSYLDLFPREKLVYLTPHCQQEMTEFNADNVYIIGCLVDKGDSQPLSLAKAKRENIKMAKLPLDKYLNFGGGSGKSLTLNAMISILLELKAHGDWERALKFVPRRKLRDFDEYSDSLLQTVVKYFFFRLIDSNGFTFKIYFRNILGKISTLGSKSKENSVICYLGTCLVETNVGQILFRH